MRFIALGVMFLIAPLTAQSESIGERPGWVVIHTSATYGDLVKQLSAAIKAEKMGLVNHASASDGARAQGITIPGNRVVGVFRNDFARRMLEASLAAGIEAPVRFYVTENPDGTATLSYRTPSAVFAPYMDEGGEELAMLAEELDRVFAAIAAHATGSTP